MSKAIINELYTCVQGEGIYTGVPSILVRFSGCRLRCQFATTLCDSWQSSWKPEKGMFTEQDVIDIMDANPQIDHVIISGGGPTLQGQALISLITLLNSREKTITLETEGSEFHLDVFEKAGGIDLLSLSPKLSNSTPKLGTYIAQLDREVKQQDIDRHENWRSRYDNMSAWIERTIRQEGAQIQVKFVVSQQSDMAEILETLFKIGYLQTFFAQDVLLMPECHTNEQMQEKQKWLEKLCIEHGFRLCTRLHIAIHGDKRFV